MKKIYFDSRSFVSLTEASNQSYINDVVETSTAIPTILTAVWRVAGTPSVSDERDTTTSPVAVDAAEETSRATDRSRSK